MAAPTSILVETSHDELSRFEPERDTVEVTITPQGTDLLGEVLEVRFVKARRSRTEVVATKLLTLSVAYSTSYSIEFDLNELVDSEGIPKVRRGEYFIEVVSETDANITGESSDFKVSLVTVDRLRADYLHGTDQMAQDTLAVSEQPSVITGVVVEEVSRSHPMGWSTLSYNWSAERAVMVTSTTPAPYTLINGQTLVLRINGGAAQTVTFQTAQFASISAATITEISDVVTAAIPSLTGSDSAGALRVTGDTSVYSIVVDAESTASLGLTGQLDSTTAVRTLSWCGGPLTAISAGKRTYLLRRGSGVAYIRVRVSSTALLPTQSRAEELLIDRRPLDDRRIQSMVEQAISWVEDSALGIYLEPTRIMTEIDAISITLPDDSDIPVFDGAEWDEIVDALMYVAPTAGHWLNFKSPYYPLIRFNELYGKMANTRVINIALEWVEHHERTGWVELVPFNQEVAFNFVGLAAVQAVRGPLPIPNFWNFDALVGFRETPLVLIELIAKKTAMDVLTIAGQAYRGGLASQSVSRDGISESVSYTASAKIGIFAAAIEDYRTWIDDNIKQFRGAFRGLNVVVI